MPFTPRGRRGGAEVSRRVLVPFGPRPTVVIFLRPSLRHTYTEKEFTMGSTESSDVDEDDDQAVPSTSWGWGFG